MGITLPLNRRMKEEELIRQADIYQREGKIPEAIKLYSASRFPSVLLGAAQLAYQNGLYDDAKRLVIKTRKNIEYALKDTPPYLQRFGPNGASRAIGNGQALERHNRYQEALRIQTILGRLETELEDIK